MGPDLIQQLDKVIENLKQLNIEIDRLSALEREIAYAIKGINRNESPSNNTHDDIRTNNIFDINKKPTS